MKVAQIIFMMVLIFPISMCENLSPPDGIEPPIINLMQYTNDEYGISCYIPDDWTQYQSGRFKRNKTGSDVTELITEFFPKMDWAWYSSSFIEEITGTDVPVGIDDIHTNGDFDWSIHRSIPLENDNQQLLNIAYCEKSTGVYVVMMINYATDQTHFYENIFLNALLTFEEYNSSYTDFDYAEEKSKFDYNSNLPLNLLKPDSTSFQLFTSYTISFDSPIGGSVPGKLLIPHGTGPFPGIVFMHSMPGTHKNIIGLAEFYAKSGAVCLLIDAPHGRPENKDRPEGAITLTATDYEEQIQLIVDLRRGIDLLVERSEVDTSRLAYIGASYGGSMGGLLAGIENRLKAYVMVVGNGGPVEHSTGYNVSFEIPPDWRDMMWPIEPLHFISHCSPAAILYQNALNDVAVSIEDAVRYQRAGSEPKEIMWYDTDHWLNVQAYLDQQVWLEQYIGE